MLIRWVILTNDHFVPYVVEVSNWIVTGERQSSRIRSLYLKTILRQDIEFFDTQTNTGEVIERMSGDTILIQDAMGEKVNLLNWLKNLCIKNHFHKEVLTYMPKYAIIILCIRYMYHPPFTVWTPIIWDLHIVIVRIHLSYAQDTFS